MLRNALQKLTGQLADYRIIVQYDTPEMGKVSYVGNMDCLSMEYLNPERLPSEAYIKVLQIFHWTGDEFETVLHVSK